MISDWGSTYSTAATVAAGMNLEMPGGEAMRTWFAKPETQKDGNGAGWLTPEKVLAAVAAGQLKQEAVDDAARRILRVMFTAGLFDSRHPSGGEVDTPEQRARGAHGRHREHRAAEERRRRCFRWALRRSARWP